MYNIYSVTRREGVCSEVISSTLFLLWHRGSASPPRRLPFPSRQADTADMKALRRSLNRWGRANVFGHVSISVHLSWSGSSLRSPPPVFDTASTCWSRYFRCSPVAPREEMCAKTPQSILTLAATISTRGCYRDGLGRIWWEFDILNVPADVLKQWRAKGKQSEMLFEQVEIIYSNRLRHLMQNLEGVGFDFFEFGFQEK